MNDIEGVSAEGDLHAIENVEKQFIRDDRSTPSSIELDGSVNGSN